MRQTYSEMVKLSQPNRRNQQIHWYRDALCLGIVPTPRFLKRPLNVINSESNVSGKSQKQDPLQG